MSEDAPWSKAVLQTKISPAYDDLPESRYHFPRMYLNQVQRTVGDWIVYYEPRRSTSDELSRGGRQSYFAIARVLSVRDDSERPDHYYADISDYLPFDRAVPFREGGHFYESAMKGADGRTNAGSAQRAVRNMPDNEFDEIIRAGFASELPLPTVQSNYDHGLSDPPETEVRSVIEFAAKENIP